MLERGKTKTPIIIILLLTLITTCYTPIYATDSNDETADENMIIADIVCTASDEFVSSHEDEYNNAADAGDELNYQLLVLSTTDSSIDLEQIIDDTNYTLANNEIDGVTVELKSSVSNEEDEEDEGINNNGYVLNNGNKLLPLNQKFLNDPYNNTTNTEGIVDITDPSLTLSLKNVNDYYKEMTKGLSVRDKVKCPMCTYYPQVSTGRLQMPKHLANHVEARRLDYLLEEAEAERCDECVSSGTLCTICERNSSYEYLKNFLWERECNHQECLDTPNNHGKCYDDEEPDDPEDNPIEEDDEDENIDAPFPSEIKNSIDDAVDYSIRRNQYINTVSTARIYLTISTSRDDDKNRVKVKAVRDGKVNKTMTLKLQNKLTGKSYETKKSKKIDFSKHKSGSVKYGTTKTRFWRAHLSGTYGSGYTGSFLFNKKCNMYPHYVEYYSKKFMKIPPTNWKKTEPCKWTSKDRENYVEWFKEKYPDSKKRNWANFQIHHIRPRGRGGNNNYSNLIPMTTDFHIKKYGVTTWWASY